MFVIAMTEKYCINPADRLDQLRAEQPGTEWLISAEHEAQWSNQCARAVQLKFLFA